MASPQFGVPTIISYGNGGSTNTALPAISQAFQTGPIMGAPSLARVGRMPILEKITPRSVNASAVARTRTAQARVIAETAVRRAGAIVAGTGRALRMRV